MSVPTAFIPATPGPFHIGAQPSITHSQLSRRRSSWTAPARTSLYPVPATRTVSVPFAMVKSGEAQTKPRRSKTPQQKPAILRRSGMNAAVVLSPKLAEMLGTDMMLRRDVISAISKYVHDAKLMTPHDKRKFVCDEYLLDTLGREHAHGEHEFLHINKLIAPSLQLPSVLGPEYQSRAAKMFSDYVKSRGALDSSTVRRQMDNRGKNSSVAQKILREKGMGMFSDVYIDGELSRLCGGKTQMSRPQLLKSVWDHIRANQLQTPTNKRKIIVDATLRAALRIFDTDVVDSFHIGRYLWKLCRSEPPSKS